MATPRPKLNTALHEASGKKRKTPTSQTEIPVTDETSTPTTSQTEVPVIDKTNYLPPSRQGKKIISGHFDPAVLKQIKQLALDNDATIQALLTEALNDLFTKHGKQPIA